MKNKQIKHLQKFFKKTLLYGIASLCVTNSFSYPYNPKPFQVDNQGDTIMVQRVGDEHYSYIQTLSGNLIEKDSLGVYRYLLEDGTLSDIKVKNEKNEKSEDKIFLRTLNKKNVWHQHRSMHPDKLVRPDSNMKRPAWVPHIIIKEGNKNDSLLSDGIHPLCKIPSSVHSVGTELRFPVLMIGGNGTANADSASYTNHFNQEGYNSNGHTGSVRDYFKDNSNGMFAPTFDLYFVTVSNTIESYIGNDYKIIEDGVKLLKSKYPNFDASQYDADKDGEVDALLVLYAGVEAFSSDNQWLGGYQYELQWNQCGRLDAGNNKKFNNYLLIAQMQSVTQILPIATVIHEFGHTMGLRDHYCVNNAYDDGYNFTNQFPGAHAWDVMSTGMYNNGGLTPAGYNAFEKEFCGWITTKTLTTSTETTVITPLNSTHLAYKVPVSGNNDEWFLLENRQNTKWDAYLPYHGMLIWHIDYDENAWNNNTMNDIEDYQHIDVVEAGTNKVQDYYSGFASNGYTNTSLADDPYPGTSNVTSFSKFISWDNVDQNIKLYNITEKNNNIYFTTQNDVNVNTDTQADTTGTSGKGQQQIATEEALEEHTFSCELTLPISDNYEPELIDLSDIAEILGITGQASTLYADNSLKFYAVEPDGSLSTNNTAREPGMWYDADGYVVEYNKGYIYGEVNMSSLVLSVGHYPNKVSNGDKYTISQAMVYNGKKVTYTVHITIGESTSVNDISNIVCYNLQQSILTISNMENGEKLIRIMDVKGQELGNWSTTSTIKEIDLTSYKSCGVVLVQILNGRKSTIQKVIIK